MELIKSTNFDFLGKRKFAYIFSSIIIILGIVNFILRGKENFGVDFKGGDLLHIEFNTSINLTEIRGILKSIGDVTVQSLGKEGKEFIIKSNSGTADEIISVLKSKFGEESIGVKAKSVIAPSMSKSLREKALISFFWGMIGILIYLTFRFEFRFAVSAVVAIIHDLLFVISILALTKQQISGTVIAALLTIAGYSVNDTVVIFDRIRENLRKTRSTDYLSLFNKSINETLSRTVLTVLTTVFVVFCLFLFGGEPLHVFSFSLLIGFIIGTYSSVFIASAILIDWDKIKPYRFKL